MLQKTFLLHSLLDNTTFLTKELMFVYQLNFRKVKFILISVKNKLLYNMKLEITLKTTKKKISKFFVKQNCAHFWMVKYLHQDFRITNQDKMYFCYSIFA